MPLTSTTERPEFHLAQPDAECVSGQNSRGRNSVRSEGALGRRTRPVAHRRDLRRPKKCPSKNLNSRRHKNRYRANRQDRTNFFSGAKRSFTGDSRGPHTHREKTWTHTNASQTHKWPQPATTHPACSQRYCRRRMNRSHSSLRPSILCHRAHTQQRPASPRSSTGRRPRTHTAPRRPRVQPARLRFACCRQRRGRWGIHTPGCRRTDRHLTNRAP